MKRRQPWSAKYTCFEIYLFIIIHKNLAFTLWYLEDTQRQTSHQIFNNVRTFVLR